MTTGPDELLRRGAVETARRLRAGEFTSTELVEAVLARIDAVNPVVNAIREVRANEALEQARAADVRIAAGRTVGPLDGVPMTVKDNVDVAGSATTQGVAAFADAIATADAPVVAHLRRAGAIPVARTNLPDFALRWHTDSGILGPTLNPYDPELTPGGSSGGEAVALATGMTFLGIGNDLGGSLRFPAQCNGIAALRPTLGRVPDASSLLPGVKPLGLQLVEVQGPMARRVEDLRVAFGLMAAPDSRDPWHTPVAPGYRADAPKRVLVLDDETADPDVRDSVRRAADALQGHGYEVRQGTPPGIDEAAACWAGLVTTGIRQAWRMLEPLASDGGRRFVELVLDLVPPLDLNQYAELFTTRHRLTRAWSEAQVDVPLVLAPISTRRPFRAGADLDDAAAVVDSLRITVAVNFLGLPAVAVPVGRMQAVQLIGPRFGEQLCLDAAAAVEAEHPPGGRNRKNGGYA